MAAWRGEIPTAGRPGGGGLRPALLLPASAAAAAFVASAAVRRLNFDEALALRAGALSLSGVPSEPGFAMPFTALLGALGLSVPDPGHVFLIARLLVSAAVLAAIALGAAWADGRPGVAAGTVVATLASAAFFVHGLEFRYDAAILVLLLAALPLLVRGSRRAGIALGAVAGLLAAHHVKGVFFAMAIVALGLARGGWRRGAHLAAGLAAALSAWLLAAAAAGILPDVSGLYASYLDLAVGTARRSPWAVLGPSLQRDAAWWALGLAAVLASLAVLPGLSTEQLRRSPDAWALALAGVSLSFPFFHPHPFPYMLVLPTPFLAFLGARRLAAAGRGVRACAGLGAAVVLALQLAAGPAPFAAHTASFLAPRSMQVEALRWLKARANPGDRVLDPSGLAYFLPPCTAQWYVDSVFEPRARAGAWMAGLGRADLKACPWMVLTYRLEMLPGDVRSRLRREYRPAHAGVALHAADPRWGGPGLDGPSAASGLDTFW